MRDDLAPLRQTTRAPEATAGHTPPSRLLIGGLAFATGAAVANLYYNQPMLGVMARDLHVGGAAIALVPTATQLGYGIGMLFLLPLGDRMDRRRLILVQAAALAVALAGAALSPGLAAIVAASVAVGVAATIAQHIIPLAAELAGDAARGRVVGTVMSGLLAGVLLARVLSGLVAAHFGWRPMFWLGSVLAVGTFLLLAALLPRTRPSTTLPYHRLLASLLAIWRARPALRQAALQQACLFGAFSAFWAMLALYLQQAPLRLGAAAAGAFGIVGLTGIAAAPLAGHIADRRGPHGVVATGIALNVAGFLLLFVLAAPGAGRVGTIGIVLGIAAAVVLLDAGVQLSMIANQTVVFSLDPAARSRLNTIYMTLLFTGGAVGTTLASLAWSRFGWTGVLAVGMALVAVGGIIRAGGRRHAAI